MSSYVKRVGDLTEPVELSASQVTEKMTSTVDTWFDPVTKPAFGAGKAWRAKASNGISTSSCGSITAMCG